MQPILSFSLTKTRWIIIMRNESKHLALSRRGLTDTWDIFATTSGQLVCCKRRPIFNSKNYLSAHFYPLLSTSWQTASLLSNCYFAYIVTNNLSLVHHITGNWTAHSRMQPNYISPRWEFPTFHQSGTWSFYNLFFQLLKRRCLLWSSHNLILLLVVIKLLMIHTQIKSIMVHLTM